MNAAQWLVVVQSPFVLLVTWFRLRRDGFQKTLERIAVVPGSGVTAAQQATLARQTAFALKVAVKIGPWWPKCLVRSLALARLLAARGVSYEVRIGVPVGQGANHAQNPDDFSAHAWVEHAGVVLNDSPDVVSRFRAFGG